MMERQVEHLVRLVDDLLEMSRITRGALELRREAVELAAVVRNAVETSRPLIDAAAHRLELALPEAPLPAHGDPVRLTQILANLLNNAARYTPRGGTIALRLERRADAAEISVRDSGRGIAPEMLPRLFGMFARGEGSTGLGIGLALARRLAEMHGGAIEARSEGIGKGAEFVVRLPLGAPGEQKSIPEPKEGRRLPRQRILVVDDNRDAADSLGMLLGFLGAEVEIANDGEAALAAFARARPAAVLLDLGMPGMDGYEVARRLRAAGADGVPIIALTGWGQEQDRRRVREAGFDKHLIKPADMGTLRALLASLS
jgi:CheY-like chemotaxis protein